MHLLLQRCALSGQNPHPVNVVTVGIEQGALLSLRQLQDTLQTWADMSVERWHC